MLSLIFLFSTCGKLRFCKMNGFTQVPKLISSRASPILQAFDFQFMVVRCTILLKKRYTPVAIFLFLLYKKYRMHNKYSIMFMADT